MNSATELNFSSMSATIMVGGHQLHYIKAGSGHKLALCFHGYGNNASMFQFLKDPAFTVLSFDLPFQGKSIGEKGIILQKKDLNDLVVHLMKEYEVQKIGLVGFSLGARICLCIADEIPNAVRNMVLIAPDGIRHNYFYQFITGTGFGRFLFRGFINFGSGYLKLFSMLHQLSILNENKYRFAMKYIRSTESRALLFNIWMTTSKLIPHLKRIKIMVTKKNIPTHLLMGNEDNIIPLKNGVKFKGHHKFIQLHVFDRGHNLLDFDEVKGTVAAWLFRIHIPTQNL